MLLWTKLSKPGNWKFAGLYLSGQWTVKESLRDNLKNNVLIGFTQPPDKLEFVGRADSQVVTNVVCFRSQPDPLGIVLRFDKLEFRLSA